MKDKEEHNEDKDDDLMVDHKGRSRRTQKIAQHATSIVAATTTATTPTSRVAGRKPLSQIPSSAGVRGQSPVQI